MKAPRPNDISEERRERISVCMATYDGEPYVVAQLRSILDQLAEDDEVIVVDDCSRDGTLNAVRGLEDPRIRVYVNERNRREVFTFGRAIELATRDVVFLSDQDDIWTPGRVNLMCRCLRESGADLVTSNFVWMDANENPLEVKFNGVSSKSSRSYLRNIVDIFIGKTNYFGCAMAFRKSLVPFIIPIPHYVESHDLWIALAANIKRSNLHIDDSTFRKRRHGQNATHTVSRRSLYLKLRSRIIFAESMLLLYARKLSQAGR
jgi:glycosyltransferase involved in cell wall biosynthesis